MRRIVSLFMISIVALVFTSVNAGAAGTITGVISAKSGGKPAKIKITKDKGVCGKTPKFKENLLVSKSGGLMAAVVEIIGAGKVKPTTVNIAQDGCQFKPHVTTIAAGSTIKINNKDGLTHNFHSFGFENDPVNFSQPGDMKVKKIKGENWEIPEVVQIKCDIHEWMEGWVVISESPAIAITDANGSFTISNVKPGKYKIKVWHGSLGEKTLDIVVKDGGNTFNLAMKK